MNETIRAVMQECTDASDQERVSFPEVVGKLAAAGVERYHADLQRHEKTYYLPSGESHLVPCAAIDAAAAGPFSAEGVSAAVREIQAGIIRYREFCRRILKAGCVGYLVSLPGRRAVYFGRTGECYVEPFPT
jgi:uncharacterized protein YbcV (DUF1398 family)